MIEVYAIMGMTEVLAASKAYLGTIDPGQYVEGIALDLDPSPFEKLIVRLKANEAE
ncbi:hypothetical protein [Nannocystis radixulma]|uniref:Uncharacterized protein n=1 Tax=Nannocystis radixulma TaxID=2995305 RepID=A0ABT5B137_9BACT|nr:hypothetical protein [Nannocystis radixulma]MDC0667815.1 hypothetical protein [Nannocystis radixulma]